MLLFSTSILRRGLFFPSTRFSRKSLIDISVAPLKICKDSITGRLQHGWEAVAGSTKS